MTASRFHGEGEAHVESGGSGRSGGGGCYGQGADGKSESGRDGGGCPGLISTQNSRVRHAGQPGQPGTAASCPRTRSPAKALFGACSAPSAALWDEDPRLRNAVLLRLARKASRPGCSSRLRVAPLESVLFCSVLFCSVLCAGRRRHERACRWEADLRSRQD